MSSRFIFIELPAFSVHSKHGPIHLDNREFGRMIAMYQDLRTNLRQWPNMDLAVSIQLNGVPTIWTMLLPTSELESYHAEEVILRS